MNIVDLLDNEATYSEAVELYLEALQVRESVPEVAYYMALARLADEHLPKGSEEPVTPASINAARKLRVVEPEGA
jgi:hypothetical protein